MTCSPPHLLVTYCLSRAESRVQVLAVCARQGLAKLPATASDDERISNLATILAHHYGPDFAADCFYDSECLRKTSSSTGPSQVARGAFSRAHARPHRLRIVSDRGCPCRVLVRRAG